MDGRRQQNGWMRALGTRIGVMVIALVAVAAIVCILLVFGPYRAAAADAEAGVAFLKAQEEADTAEVEEQIKAIQREERKAAVGEELENGEVSVWSLFDGVVLLGDSRTLFFLSYGFLDETHVIAEKGLTVSGALDYLDELITRNPSALVLQFGLNDTGLGPDGYYFEDAEAYVAGYDEVLKVLQDALPDTTLFVQSCIPTTEETYENAPSWAKIPEWNAALKAHCEEIGVPFIDLTDTIDAFLMDHTEEEMYTDDGTHLASAFYLPWATTLVTEIAAYE